VKGHGRRSPARVDRGGSWYDNVPSWLRGATRDWDAPSGRDALIGFRMVLDIPKERK